MEQMEESDIEIDCCNGESSREGYRRRRRELEEEQYGPFHDEEKMPQGLIICICVFIIIMFSVIIFIVKYAASKN